MFIITGYILCSAVCTPGCQNGGTCIAPNQCACTTSWTGSNCTQGLYVSFTATQYHRDNLHRVDADYKDLVSTCFGVPFCSCLCSRVWERWSVYCSWTLQMYSGVGGRQMWKRWTMSITLLLLFWLFAYFCNPCFSIETCEPPCQNGGACYNGTCVCQAYWEGPVCQSGTS